MGWETGLSSKQIVKESVNIAEITVFVNPSAALASIAYLASLTYSDPSEFPLFGAKDAMDDRYARDGVFGLDIPKEKSLTGSVAWAKLLAHSKNQIRKQIGKKIFLVQLSSGLRIVIWTTE